MRLMHLPRRIADVFSRDVKSTPDLVVDRQLEELKLLLPLTLSGVALCSLFMAATFYPRMPTAVAVLESILVAVLTVRIVSCLRLDLAALSIADKRRKLAEVNVSATVLGLYCSLFVFTLSAAAAPGEHTVLLMWTAFCGVGVAMSVAVLRFASRAVMIGSIAPYGLFLLLTGRPAEQIVSVMVLASVPIGLHQYTRLSGLLASLTIQEATAERQRRYAKESLRAFMEMASDWAWETDAEHRLTYISPRITDLLGVQPETILGKHLLEAGGREFYSNDSEARRRFEEALRTNTNLRGIEHEVRDSSGRRRVISSTMRHYYDETGRYTGARGWTSDITEKVNRDRALAESQKRYRDFAESASDWVWETDENCAYTYFSEGAERSTGIKHDRYIGVVAGATHSPSVNGVPSELSRAITAREAFREFIFPIKTGDSTVWISQSGKPVFDEKGAFRGYRGIGRNVTERMEAQHAAADALRKLEETNANLERIVQDRTRSLSERTELLDEVFETMAEGLLVLDKDLRIVARNAKAQLMTNLPDSYWEIGASIMPALKLAIEHGVYQDKTVDDFMARIQAHMADGAPIQTLRVQADGRFVQENARARRSGGIVVTYSDITDLTKRQQQLEEISKELRKAKDEAIAASRAKSDFLANMSHEIRTPMNGVVGMASLLLGSDIPPKQKEMARVIVSSGENLLKIINDILDFSRLEAGKLKIASEAFDLREVVEDVAALLSLRIQEKGLKFFVRFEPTLGRRFVGDPGRLRQVIINLLGNAVKFTDSGHIVLDIAGKPSGDAATIDISVTDTGCGIPPNKLSAIFDEFEQVDNSPARRFDGAGLGLAITKGIVEAMGGRVAVVSEVGKGSTFRISVPLAIDRQSGDAEAAPAPVFAGARVLIVDESSVGRSILAELLTAWGVAVTTLDDGRVAAAMAGSAANSIQAFDAAIFCDPTPGVDAIELGRIFKADETLAAIPLILLSAESCGNEISASVAGLFDACLSTPPRTAALLEALAACLRTRTDLNLEALSAHAAAAKPVSAGPAACTLTDDGSPLDVLVAEDNIVNQMVIKAMLEQLGCAPRLVADGAEAISAYKKSPPAVVLMDISMPGVDGIEATRLIRAMQAGTGKRVPIIGVTAHALREDRARCLAAGMDDHLAKPIKREALLDMLSRWTPRKTSGTKARRA